MAINPNLVILYWSYQEAVLFAVDIQSDINFHTYILNCLCTYYCSLHKVLAVALLDWRPIQQSLHRVAASMDHPRNARDAKESSQFNTKMPIVKTPKCLS